MLSIILSSIDSERLFSNKFLCIFNIVVTQDSTGYGISVEQINLGMLMLDMKLMQIN